MHAICSIVSSVRGPIDLHGWDEVYETSVKIQLSGSFPEKIIHQGKKAFDNGINRETSGLTMQYPDSINYHIFIRLIWHVVDSTREHRLLPNVNLATKTPQNQNDSLEKKNTKPEMLINFGFIINN